MVGAAGDDDSPRGVVYPYAYLILLSGGVGVDKRSSVRQFIAEGGEDGTNEVFWEISVLEWEVH